jgi:HEAT repeat protein
MSVIRSGILVFCLAAMPGSGCKPGRFTGNKKTESDPKSFGSLPLVPEKNTLQSAKDVFRKTAEQTGKSKTVDKKSTFKVVEGLFASLSPAKVKQVKKLVKDLGSGDWETRNDAVHLIPKFGEGAIPYLLPGLKKYDDEVLSRLHLFFKKYADNANFSSYVGAASSGSISTEEIIAKFGGKKRISRMVSCYIKLPPEVAPRRGAAVFLLRYFGKDGLSTLIEGLRHKNANIRCNSCFALTQIGRNSRPAVPAILNNLVNDKTVYGRDHAARALGAVGPAAREAVPELKKAMKDPEASIQQEAALAYWRITLDSVTAIRVLEGTLDDPREEIPHVSNWALRMISYESDRSIADLIALLGSDQTKGPERARAVLELGIKGRKAIKALPALKARFKDSDPAVRIEAFLAASRVSGNSREALAGLKKELSSRDYWVRGNAVSAIGRLGLPVAKVAPVIKGLLKDGNAYVRRSAGQVLMGRKSPEWEGPIEVKQW